MDGQATIAELRLVGGRRAARLMCDPSAIPSPGRYVHAHEEGSSAPLATDLFAAEYRSDGFVAAPPIPHEWQPGSVLNVRGPLGKGFELPKATRRVALIAYQTDPSRLLPIVEAAIRQQAAVALVCEDPPTELPLQVEVHPPRALGEVFEWSDFAAFDLDRDAISELRALISADDPRTRSHAAQALIRVPMPCAGLAECGVCTVRAVHGPKLACVDGPVFDLNVLLGKV